MENKSEGIEKSHQLNLSVVSQYRNEMFGLSILSIIVFHFCEAVLLTKNPAAAYAYNFANTYNQILSSAGVEIFLFLSGMGLFYSMKKNGNVLQFYSKRFKRVLIPYLIFGLIYWIVNDFVIYHYDFVQFINDFLLISIWTQGIRRFWFIGFILLLYIVFPLFFKLLDTTVKHRGLIFALLLAVTLTACGLAKTFTPDGYNNIELAICRIPIFLFGVYYGGKIYNAEPFGLLEKILIPLGLLVRTFTFAVRNQWLPVEHFWNVRYEVCLFALSLVFLTAIVLAKINSNILNKALAAVGTYSLELYMTHVAIRNIMHAMGYPTYLIGNYAICLAISVALSVLLHQLTNLILSKPKRKAADTPQS